LKERCQSGANRATNIFALTFENSAKRHLALVLVLYIYVHIHELILAGYALKFSLPGEKPVDNDQSAAGKEATQIIEMNDIESSLLIIT